jgi:hypothetical protein
VKSGAGIQIWKKMKSLQINVDMAVERMLLGLKLHRFRFR